MAQSFGWMWDDRPDRQQLFSAAVVVPTIVRPSLARALASIYAQDIHEPIQILIGVDRAVGDVSVIEEAARTRPRNVAIYVLALPYSTSVRNRGLHSASDGGSLRAALALAAHSRHVAFLDDDNAWTPVHLRTLKSAIGDKAYAFSRRMLVRDDDFSPIVEDRWDSLGPDRGRFAASGGFVDPNCLLIDKVRLAHAIGRWAETSDGRPGVTADRHFFAAIGREPFGESGAASVLYATRPTNVMLRFAVNEAQPRAGAGDNDG